MGFSRKGKKIFDQTVNKYLGDIAVENEFAGGGRACSSDDAATDLHLTVGNGARFTMYAEDYIVSRRAGGPCTLNSLSINTPPSYGNLIILGEPFFRRHIVVFDPHEMQVGIGRHIFGNRKKWSDPKIVHPDRVKSSRKGGVFDAFHRKKKDGSQTSPFVI